MNYLNKLRYEKSGVALIMAIILILIMSTLATTISFLSNNDFASMGNYNRGQEAFLASESCVIETRKILENVNPGVFFELNRSSINKPEELKNELGSNVFVLKPINFSDDPLDDPDTWVGPVCRTGSRSLDSEEIKQPSNFLILDEFKSTRHAKNFSIGQFNATPVTLIVTGKDSQDQDKTDTREENEDNEDDINTGIEIITGFEVLTPGGGGNVYE